MTNGTIPGNERSGRGVRKVILDAELFFEIVIQNPKLSLCILCDSATPRPPRFFTILEKWNSLLKQCIPDLTGVSHTRGDGVDAAQ
ncbi:hypothetical protein [Thiohalophilus thiocyanatoxydans]|uniref:hypothetical protein n=1 Tax=Thiohalophilus thiocyanatoxydans TaxID=381308 RepID=UPI0010658BEF|nr:hypothetical protein [Thiohalophilus thiocyanatoxydans]